jgi:hypothetical protein
MIRRRAAAELSPWIERARAAATNDEATVRAAIHSPCSTDRLKVRSRLKLVGRHVAAGKSICLKPD